MTVLAYQDPGSLANNVAFVLMCLVIALGAWYIIRGDRQNRPGGGRLRGPTDRG